VAEPQPALVELDVFLRQIDRRELVFHDTDRAVAAPASGLSPVLPAGHSRRRRALRRSAPRRLRVRHCEKTLDFNALDTLILLGMLMMKGV
jgi:hypothetical protein